MLEPDRTDDAPSFPWGPIALVALAAFGAIALVQWVVGAIVGLVKFAIVVALIVAAVGWALSRKIDR